MFVRRICGFAGLAAMVAGLVVGGCGQGPSDSAGPLRPAGASSTAQAPDSQPDSHDAVSLQSLDEVGFARLLRRHRGEVVLVDFWATWCLPCVELFPHTVELYDRWAERGLAVVSISFDEPENRPQVVQFLAEKQAKFENYISPYGISPRNFEAFEIEDGALPHLKLYDRSGKLRASFGTSTGPFTGADIDRAVEQLLAES